MHCVSTAYKDQRCDTATTTVVLIVDLCFTVAFLWCWCSFDRRFLTYILWKDVCSEVRCCGGALVLLLHMSHEKLVMTQAFISITGL